MDHAKDSWELGKNCSFPHFKSCFKDGKNCFNLFSLLMTLYLLYCLHLYFFINAFSNNLTSMCLSINLLTCFYNLLGHDVLFIFKFTLFTQKKKFKLCLNSFLILFILLLVMSSITYIVHFL